MTEKNRLQFAEDQVKEENSGTRPEDMPAFKITEETQNRAKSYLDTLFAAEPQPQPDKKKAERLQKMGKINQLGQGINVLGDMLALGLGANVNRRRPDENAPRIYQAYSDMLDKEKGDMEAWQIRDINRKDKKAMLELDQANRDKLLDLQNRKLEADTEEARRKADLEFKKFAAEMGLKGAQFDESVRHNKQTEGANWARANKTGTDNDIEVRTASQDYKMSKKDFNYLYNNAIGNQEVINQHPEWYDKKEITHEAVWGEKDKNGNELQPGTKVVDEVTYVPKPHIKETAFVQAQLELGEKSQAQQKQINDTSKNYQAGKLPKDLVKPTTQAPKAETRKKMPDGKISIFNTATKQFIRYE